MQQEIPMRITAPSGQVPTIQQWRDELQKVYYQNKIQMISHLVIEKSK